MLKSIHLENFRGFRDHFLPLRQRTIIVGANNAGKSTAVEALRLVSLMANRYRNLNYSHPPLGAGVPVSAWVASPSLESFNINFDNLFYLLGEPPSVITAQFTGGEITLHLTDTQRVYAEVKNTAGESVRNKAEANKVNLDEVHILPQVAPLVRDEKALSDSYVRSHISSPLAPIHFRNQLRLMPDAYFEFRRLASETWPRLVVCELVPSAPKPGDILGLIVQDGEFGAEVCWMGHGLQMWLQTIWFLARTPRGACVVLDEPDVYLHPDLQRRLFRLVRSRYAQLIVATHSIEIMAEADPHDILVIDRTQETSRFADDHPTVQRLVDHIGSSQNVNLARLHATSRFLLIEGDDLDFLSRFHTLLFPNTAIPLASLPHLPVGGWGGWDYAIGSGMTLRNYIGGEVVTYCILDSDYHTKQQITDRYAQAQKRGIELHVWSRKEIENYVLVPDAIGRFIGSRLRGKQAAPTTEEIGTQIDAIAEKLKEDLTTALGNELLNEDRKGGLPSAMRRAHDLVNSAWPTRESRWGLIPGKEVLSQLSDWAQKLYGVSFGPMSILREMEEHEIPREVANVVRAIERRLPVSRIRASA